MTKQIFTIMFVATAFISQTFAQDAAAPVDGWKRGSGLGLSLDQLALINPRSGAGLNRLGIGGMATWFGNLKKGSLAWDNGASLNLGVQRLGAGLVAGSTQKNPFQKNVDDLRLNSKLGYKVAPTSHWFYATDFQVITQLLETYKGGLLRPDATGTSNPLSKFFAPGFVTLALGMDYKPTEHLSWFISPLAYKANIVMDDAIAATGAYGNEVRGIGDFDKVFHQAGAMTRAIYTNKYFKDKFIVKSNLSLFSNYLKGPQNIDVDWTNEFGYELIKGLQLSLFTNIWYDHDSRVQISDKTAPNGVVTASDGTPVLGQRASIIESFLIKYAMTF